MGSKRRRFKQTDSLGTRLEKFARHMREEAARKEPGEEKKDLLKRAYNADQAIELERRLRAHS